MSAVYRPRLLAPLSWYVLGFPLFADVFACYGHAETPPVCSDIALLRDAPITNLSPLAQEHIRSALKPSIEALIADPGMPLRGTHASTVPLNAIRLATPSPLHVLYLVTWNERIFGVNGFNWMVKDGPTGARNVSPGRTAHATGGFGVGLLSRSVCTYPEIVIASRGFKASGGADAEDVCFAIAGPAYQRAICPADCYKHLNAR